MPRYYYCYLFFKTLIFSFFFIPGIAWLVIPFKMVDHETLWPIYSWRLFLALSSIPGFISGTWVLYLPESPRLLSDTNRSDKALKILASIYKSNHGSSTEYKVRKFSVFLTLFHRNLGPSSHCAIGVPNDL